MPIDDLSYRVFTKEGEVVSHDIDGLPQKYRAQQEFIRLVLADSVLSSIFLLVMTGERSYSMRLVDLLPHQIREQIAQLGITLNE